MSDIDRLLGAMRGPEPPSEPPKLPDEDEGEGAGRSGPGLLPMLLAAMVLLGIGVVTLSPDSAEVPSKPSSSEAVSSPRADTGPAAGPAEAVDFGDLAAPEPEAPAAAKRSSGAPSAGAGAPAVDNARDPDVCLEQYGVEGADVELEIGPGGLVLAVDLIEPRSPDLEGCLRRALLGTKKPLEAGTQRQAL